MTIGERIKEARLRKGLTQAELAELLGYKSRSSINKIEVEGRDIPRSSIVKFAEVLGVSPSYLMGWDEDTKNDLQTINSPDFTVEPAPAAFVRVPVIGEVAAGTSCLADMDTEEYVTCDSSLINDGYEYCYLKVKGDSMEPLIRENDMVLVRIQDTVPSGSYAVVLVDDDNGLVKRVEYDDQHFTLISENPYYPPRKFVREDMNRIRIFGLVVETRRRFV